MIASAALSQEPEDAKPTHCMLVDVELCGSHGKRKLFALLDMGAQGETFCHRLWRLKKVYERTQYLRHPVVVYGKNSIDTVITDSQKESRSSSADFTTTDIQKYDAILGWP